MPYNLDGEYHHVCLLTVAKRSFLLPPPPPAFPLRVVPPLPSTRASGNTKYPDGYDRYRYTTDHHRQSSTYKSSDAEQESEHQHQQEQTTRGPESAAALVGKHHLDRYHHDAKNNNNDNDDTVVAESSVAAATTAMLGYASHVLYNSPADLTANYDDGHHHRGRHTPYHHHRYSSSSSSSGPGNPHTDAAPTVAVLTPDGSSGKTRRRRRPLPPPPATAQESSRGYLLYSDQSSGSDKSLDNASDDGDEIIVDLEEELGHSSSMTIAGADETMIRNDNDDGVTARDDIVMGHVVGDLCADWLDDTVLLDATDAVPSPIPVPESVAVPALARGASAKHRFYDDRGGVAAAVVGGRGADRAAGGVDWRRVVTEEKKEPGARLYEGRGQHEEAIAAVGRRTKVYVCFQI